MITKKFGKRVKELRMKRRISQEELSFRCGLHRNYVSDAERGKRNVSLKALEKFSKGLNVPLHYLLNLGDQND